METPRRDFHTTPGSSNYTSTNTKFRGISSPTKLLPKTTGSESVREVIETADDLQHLKLVKNEEQSEQSKENLSNGRHWITHRKISAEELTEANLGQVNSKILPEADSS
ncbi:hypothetical protein NPIL_479731 [Nephila pilipes]|uniref:Uncharacterized protein n=1 Tax=Nephila pilipes TaxID=299642 RepID=A0A8X6PMI1_NEPPI|nr:hypothetical protein NPIL_479731 [Nephila pilipes]